MVTLLSLTHFTSGSCLALSVVAWNSIQTSGKSVKDMRNISFFVQKGLWENIVQGKYIKKFECLNSNEFVALWYIADYQDFLLYDYFALSEHLLHGFNLAGWCSVLPCYLGG